MNDKEKENKINEAQNENTENKEATNENIETKKDEKLYNNNSESTFKNLEQEVESARNEKYLAKVIVDLQDENKEIKNLLINLNNKINANTNNLSDSEITSTNTDEDKFIINVKDYN